MQNLLKETIEDLKYYNKTLDDVLWIGTRDYKITKEQFIELADFEYEDGFGSQKVATDLVIVLEDMYFTRAEYDGSEWWEPHSFPKEPTETKEIKGLIITDFVEDLIGWKTLDYISQAWESKEERDNYLKNLI